MSGASHPALAREFLDRARHSLRRHHLPRIARCLSLLSAKEIWWRGNSASNSAGNLALHLEGNVRQWIVSGLGGAPDRRQRDLEFTARGPLSRRELLRRLTKTVNQACRVLGKLPPRGLGRARRIQGFRVSGFQAVAHVTEHFAYHTGQIVYVTKLLRRRDLKFTRLPGKGPARGRPARLPVL